MLQTAEAVAYAPTSQLITTLCLTGNPRMRPRITLITIGVDDLERSLRFYRDGLGLKTEGIVGTQFEHGAVAFFDLQAGLKLAFGRAKVSPMTQIFLWEGQGRLNSRSGATCPQRPKLTP